MPVRGEEVDPDGPGIGREGGRVAIDEPDRRRLAVHALRVAVRAGVVADVPGAAEAVERLPERHGRRGVHQDPPATEGRVVELEGSFDHRRPPYVRFIAPPFPSHRKADPGPSVQPLARNGCRLVASRRVSRTPFCSRHVGEDAMLSTTSLVTAGLVTLASPGLGVPAPATGTLVLRVVEARGTGPVVPVPARVHLADANGKPVLAPGLPSFRDHFNCDGACGSTCRPAVTPTPSNGAPSTVATPGPSRVAAGENGARGRAAANHRPGGPGLVLGRDPRPPPARRHAAAAPLRGPARRPGPHRLEPHQPLAGSPATRRTPGRGRACALYHLLACEDERRGGALLYFNLERPSNLSGDGPEVPSPVVHLHEALEQAGAWIDVEKPFWWDMPAWVATGQVRSIGLANNHMCRRTMLDNEAWGRPARRDSSRRRGATASTRRRSTTACSTAACACRRRPARPRASCPTRSGTTGSTCTSMARSPTTPGGAASEKVARSSPTVRCSGRGQRQAAWRGAPFRPAGSLSVSLDVRVLGHDPLEAVEVIRDGAVVERLAGAVPGARAAAALSFDRSGWFLVRAVAAVPETFRFASTAPSYVEVGGRRATVHRADVAFFLAWIDERIATLEEDPQGDLRDAARGRRRSCGPTARPAGSSSGASVRRCEC